MPMSRVKRKRLLENLVLGILLTGLVVALEWGGQLISIERWLGDRRARWCQFSHPDEVRQLPGETAGPPSLVHLDIDENAVQEIGRWPWPRNVLAEMLDEINRAKPRLVVLDIMFPEPQEPTVITEVDDAGKQKLVKVDHDAKLVAALRRGPTLLPVNFEFPVPPAEDSQEQQLRRKIAGMFEKDLGISSDSVAAALSKQGAMEDFDERQFEIECASAQREAVLRRVRVLAKRSNDSLSLDQLWAQLDPDQKLMTLRAPAARELAKLQAVEILGARFATTAPTISPVKLLSAADTFPPIPQIAGVVRGTGYIDYIPSDDGILRGVPLCVMYEGRIFPQLGLTMACAVRGADLGRISVRPGGITIPCVDGSLLQIPTRTYESARFGKVDGFFEIPLQGTSDWRTMYDRVRHRDFLCHEPISLVWHLTLARQNLRYNNELADQCIDTIVKHTGVSLVNADRYRRSLEEVTLRSQDIQLMLDEARKWLSSPRQEDARGEVQEAHDFLKDVLPRMRDFASHEKDVHEKLSGRVVLVGAVATGIGDFIPTTLHPKSPGVVIHGAIYNSIVTGNMYQYAPRYLGSFLAMIGGLIATLTVAYEKTPWRAFAICVVVLTGYLAVNGLWMFDHENWIVPVGGLVVAILVVWLGLSLLELVVETAQRRLIQRRFQTYRDPQLLDYVLEHPDEIGLAGQVKELSIVFTDLAGFTTITEELGEKSVPILNQYLGEMVPIIRKNGGYINRFQGDGILFFFGAPFPTDSYAHDAISTALKLQAAMPELNRQLNLKLDPEL
jgi:CHASE2 domain-containing sensor protein